MSGNEKASPKRGRGKLSRRRRACSPGLDKQAFHRTLILAGWCSSCYRIRRASRAARSRSAARAYTRAAPGALVVYGTKAFANVAILGVLAEEGVGADVSTLGELAFARAAGI